MSRAVYTALAMSIDDRRLTGESATNIALLRSSNWRNRLLRENYARGFDWSHTL